MILGPSEWRRVEQHHIDAFAELTGDHQWIHVDVERARVETILAGEPDAGGWARLVQRFTVELKGAPKPACVADSVVLVRSAEP